MGKLATSWGAQGGLLAANGSVVLLGGANSTNDVPGAATLGAPVCSECGAEQCAPFAAAQCAGPRVIALTIGELQSEIAMAGRCLYKPPRLRFTTPQRILRLPNS